MGETTSPTDNAGKPKQSPVLDVQDPHCVNAEA